MLKKLLPISQLLERLRNLKKSPNLEDQEPLNLSPNLLEISQTNASPISTIASLSGLKVVGSIQKFIIIVQIVFLIVFGLNYMLDQKIDQAAAEVTNLELSIKSYGDMVTKSESLINRIERYKSLTQNRVSLSDRIKFILENSRYAHISTLNVTSSSIAVSASADQALNFALLLNDYFANKSITQVILKSANYGGTGEFGSFSVEMELVY